MEAKKPKRPKINKKIIDAKIKQKEKQLSDKKIIRK